ncbi:MAG: hypothetical protein HY074_14520 [Deltaproteobacteria bacterium]|nr:hypothetical protein [Deltaproteobacteria bacterium]
MATALMRELIAHARAAGVSSLHLGATADGKGVYTRVGFKPVRNQAMELDL